MFGICFDLVLGPFKSGGHLVLHEARTIFKLYRGDIFLFPSSCTTHENIGIGDDDIRYSMTGFFPASLLRFVAQGMKTKTEMEADLPELAASLKSGTAKRIQEGWQKFKTVEQLKAHWESKGKARPKSQEGPRDGSSEPVRVKAGSKPPPKPSGKSKSSR